MRVCVGTIVHHPEDARIAHRQIRALLDAGHEVTFVAPFTDCNVTPRPEIRAVDVPHAVGLRRGAAIRAARAALKHSVRDCDLLLVHDVELLVALPRHRPPTVWDVRRDASAALAAEGRDILAALVRGLTRRAERRVHLILAEDALSARFPGDHPIVPDHPDVPAVPPTAPGDRRVVYLGRVRAAHGALEMIELARLLKPHGIRLDVIGPADPGIRPLLRDAQQQGLLDWFGFVPNRYALRMAEGALAGLSLLHDRPDHRAVTPTKVIEYMSRGIPVVTTPLPKAAALVDRAGCGVVVPFGDVRAVAEAALRAVLDLRDAPERRAAMGARGHAEALRAHDWLDRAAAFVALLERWADAPAPSVRPLPRAGRAVPI